MTNITTVAPHSYPLWVKILGLIVIISLFNSLMSVPKYFTASQKISNGRNAYYNRQYTEAIKHYESVLATIPASKEAKISLAEIYFTQGKPEDIEKGLTYLEGIELEQADNQRLIKALPEHYQQKLEKLDQN